MKFLNTKAGMMVAGVAAAGVVLVIVSSRAKRAVASTANAINPVNNDNVFAAGVDAIGDAFDDGDQANDSFSLGSWLFDLVNPEYDPNADTAAIQTTGDDFLQEIIVRDFSRARTGLGG